MEVLYHIRVYFLGISPYIGLIEALYMVGTSNKSVPTPQLPCVACEEPAASSS